MSFAHEYITETPFSEISVHVLSRCLCSRTARWRAHCHLCNTRLPQHWSTSKANIQAINQIFRNNPPRTAFICGSGPRFCQLSLLIFPAYLISKGYIITSDTRIVVAVSWRKSLCGPTITYSRVKCGCRPLKRSIAQSYHLG